MPDDADCGVQVCTGTLFVLFTLQFVVVQLFEDDALVGVQLSTGTFVVLFDVQVVVV